MRFSEAAALFEEVQSRYMRFGATDTEPRAVFAMLIVAVLDGERPQVPSTARGWQLFSDMSGADAVAEKLAAAAEEAVAAAVADAAGARRFLGRS